MPFVQFLVPDLGHTAAAKQVSLIAPALTDPNWSSEVFPLTRAGRAGALTGPLRAGGVTVVESSARSAIRWLGLRFVVPTPGRGLVHAFGLGVLRRLWGGTVGASRPPVVLSLTGRERLGRFDRRCLRIVSRVLVPHQHAADALSRQGIPTDRISIVPPAVASFDAPRRMPSSPLCGDEAFAPAGSQLRRAELLASDAERRTREVPQGVPLIVTASHMPDRLRLIHAVWMFEFIRYPHEDVHMLVVGDGPGRPGLEATARGLAPEGSRIHFLGERPDLSELLAGADVVHVPHLCGGVNVALEAMAAGRAVVAANTPDLAAVIRDGETGRLVPPGDALEAAKAIRQLLLDPSERHRLGEAARAHVREHHRVEAVVRTLETIYRNEFASTGAGLSAE